MSNGLWTTCLMLAETTSAPASQSSTNLPFPRQGVVLVILGILILLGWIIRSSRHLEVLTLRKTPPRDNSLNPLHVMGVFLIFFSLSYVLFQIFRWAFPDWSEFSAVLLAGMIGQTVTIVLSLLVGAFCFTRGLRGGLGLNVRHVGFDTIRGVSACLAIYPICMGLVLVSTLLLKEFSPKLIIPHSFLEQFRAASIITKNCIVISAVILASLAEELLFRGLLQSMLRQILGPWAAILITSLGFALVHGQPQSLLGLFALSIVLGYSYERTGRLLAPILTHSLFNVINLLMVP